MERKLRRRGGGLIVNVEEWLASHAGFLGELVFHPSPQTPA